MGNITFQYASDLHLEIWNSDKPFEEFITPPSPFKKDNTCLILAGDIAPITHNRLKPFLEWCSNHYKLVFYVSGNHEFYSKGVLSIEESIYLKQEICSDASSKNDYNVIPLDKEIYIIKRDGKEDIVIIGATLWSQIDFDKANSINKCINDHRQIRDFNLYVHVQKHKEELEFIQQALHDYPTDKYTRIVITHHAPLKTNLVISPLYRGDVNNSAFTTDLEDVVRQSDYWVHGHTHYTVVNNIGQCIVMANCKGHSRDVGNKYKLKGCFIE